MKEDPPPDARCRDKFLVQSVAVDANTDAANIGSVWSNIDTAAKSSVQEKKIRVSFLPADAAGATTNGVSSATSTHEEEQPPAYSSPSPSAAAVTPQRSAAASTSLDKLSAATTDLGGSKITSKMHSTSELQTTSPLMRLPPELHLQIYSQLFATRPNPVDSTARKRSTARTIETTNLFAINATLRHEATHQFDKYLKQHFKAAQTEEVAFWAQRPKSEDFASLKEWDEAVSAYMKRKRALKKAVDVYGLLMRRSRDREFDREMREICCRFERIG